MDEETKTALKNLRDHYDLLIDANEKRWQTVLGAQREALRVAADANDKRFTVLNGFREAMADQGSRMLTRQEAESNNKAFLEKIDAHRSAMESRVEAEVKPLQARLEEVGRPNWALMTSMASAAFLVVAAVWMIIGLKIDATMSPLALEISQMRTAQITNANNINLVTNQAIASTAADAASKSDRDQLNVRMRAAENANSERRTQLSVLDARMVEIETQFCSRDIISNLMHANELRVLAMLWHRTFSGSIYPTDNAFYPKVCNQNVAVPSKGDQ